MKLDLNTFRRPSLDITLCDEAQTEVRVTVPTEGTIRELTEVLPTLQTAADGNDPEALGMLYDFTAKLVNTNLDHFHCTGEELRTVYGLELTHITVLLNHYIDFILDLGKNTPSRMTSAPQTKAAEEGTTSTR